VSGSTGATGDSSTSPSIGSGSSGGSSGSEGGGDGGLILVCPSVAVPPLQITCPSSGEAFPCQTVDFLQCTPVANANIQAIAPDGVPYSGVAATTNAMGAFDVCLPKDQPFTIEVTGSGYPTTYLPELDGLSDDGLGQIPLIGEDEVGALTSLVPGGYQSNQGLIILKIDSTGPCDTQLGGWSLSLQLPDGGSFPDGGYSVVYMGSSPVPDPTATSTSTLGLALIYNIDTSLSNFVVPVAESPAGNTSCQPLNAQLGFTGRIYITGNSGSLFTVLLP